MDLTIMGTRSPGVSRTATNERRIQIENHGITRIKTHGTRITNHKTTKSQNLKMHASLLLKM